MSADTQRIERVARTISATEARVHLGEVLRGVAEERATYYVERSSTPIAVVVPVEEYEALIDRQRGEYQRPESLQSIIRIGQDWSAERVDHTPIEWERYIDEGREVDRDV